MAFVLVLRYGQQSSRPLSAIRLGVEVIGRGKSVKSLGISVNTEAQKNGSTEAKEKSD